MSSATLRRCVVAGCKKFSVSRNHCAEHARAAARRNSSEDMSTLDRELGTPRLTVIAKMIAEEREYIQAINYLIVNLVSTCYAFCHLFSPPFVKRESKYWMHFYMRIFI